MSVFKGIRFDTPLQLKSEWAGFDLMRLYGKDSNQVPHIHRRGALSVLSGCITTVAPMKNQAGWDLSLGWVDPRCSPDDEVPFMAPTMMSRYEGIYQCGTSAVFKPNNQIYINFSKNANPMVLHFSGLCTVHSKDAEEPIEIPVAQYELHDWMAQSNKAQSNNQEAPWALKPSETKPPGLCKCGSFVFLRGELQTNTYGPVAQRVGTLPEGFRPKREIRGLTYLLREEDTSADVPLVEHMVALTIRPDGTISVQGGKQQMVDQKGTMRLLQQKKKGRLSLENMRFSLIAGLPITLAPRIAEEAAAYKQKESAKSNATSNRGKLDYLMSDGENASTAICVRQDDVVMLEGHVAWLSSRPPNAKQPLALLPKGCWPRHRETFFTRGGSDLEERRRVDIDVYGRIFCPEGAADCRVELSGIIFVAAEMDPDLKPPDPDWDELKLQYHRTEASALSTSFDGHELLEAFARRSNHHEWRMLHFDFKRHALMDIMMPLGAQVNQRGCRKDPFNLGDSRERVCYKAIWDKYEKKLKDKYTITHAYTILHLTDPMFVRVAREVGMANDEISFLSSKRRELRRFWEAHRKPGLSYQYLEDLAIEIVDQMFEHWDFRAQLQGALQNDTKPPASIEHLFPRRDNSYNDRLIKKNIKGEDVEKFEEIRQFFFLYETTGCNMTHCSLMGSQDVFTTTGKWHFPDAPQVQKQLFENIAWLFPRKMYLYISERQTQRFPFIEDLDIQAAMDYQKWQPGEDPYPPDDLIMMKPIREQRLDEKTNKNHSFVTGEPGELMRKRAMAIHMVYPQLDQLEVLVYSASGYNKGKDMLKSSFHLVWPQLIVDPDRAPVLRYATLGVFQKETKEQNSFLYKLQQRFLELHESNNWELVFDNTTIHARNGLRLPYSDKASMVIENPEDKKRVKEGTLSKNKAFKKRVREDRPSRAVGKIVFEFDKDAETGNDVLISSKWVADKDSYTIAEWIGFGTCRRDPNSCVELTPWQLGPDVLEMLPFKPGERMVYSEGIDDGEGGHWVTHRPFPNIRRCNLEVPEFQRAFSEAIQEEQMALEEEKRDDLLKRIIGVWVSADKNHAIWRTTATSQCPFKSVRALRGADVARKQGAAYRMQRPVEVAYLKNKGKVVVDGPQEEVDAVLRSLKQAGFTRPDDNAVMPIYDLQKISKPPGAN